ncbi:ankyrin repeat domain-containing protein [Dehalobacter sp. DCM]|uniref:ankyrin repeat domain-containing protein n=1 Tax=Dehalobacter sp. DCM TaxID=2907827 RepID=UPI00308144CD|nr:ankyrin repeat domain-containing protein [Dehalobacter sp. DCM]
MCWTALDWAVQDNKASSGNLDIMQLLLGKGSDINAQDSYGETALFYAVYYEQPDAVKLLLTSGADKGIKNVRIESIKSNNKENEAELNDSILEKQDVSRHHCTYFMCVFACTT